MSPSAATLKIRALYVNNFLFKWSAQIRKHTSFFDWLICSQNLRSCDVFLDV